MPPQIALPLYALFAFGMLAALGAGPSTWVAQKGRRDHLLLAPAIGFSIAACIMTTAAFVMPLSVAAFAVLLPCVCLSLLWAIRVRGRGDGPFRGLWPATGIGLFGLVGAVMPGIIRGTFGPLSLFVFDGWGYIEEDLWLQGHRLSDLPPCCYPNPDLTLSAGHGFTTGGIRIGVSAVNAPLTTLLETTPDRTHLAFMAALLAMVPLAVFWAARRLGASTLGASIGACFGLSPAIFMFIADSTLGNLAATFLVLPASVMLVLALRGDRLTDAALAAVLIAGLICAYPEFLLPLVLSAIAGLILTVIVDRRRAACWRRIGARGAVAAACIAVLAPVGLVRALEYLASRQGDGAWTAGLPPRYLTGETIGAWSFGVVHLYELQRWTLFRGFREVAVVALPLALLVVLVAGLVRIGWRRATFVIVPIVTSVVLGVWAHDAYQSGRCEYCLWKSLTFMLPFLATGLGLATTVLLCTKRRRLPARLAALVVGAVSATGIAGLVRSNVELGRALVETPAAVPQGLRDIGSHVAALPKGARVMLEGADATGSEAYSVPAFYYFTRGQGRRVRFDARTGTQYLLSLGGPPEAYYQPDYEYVFSAFPGVTTDRTRIATSGPYSLSRRSPIDVAIVHTGYAQDASEHGRAIAWITSPFELWVASPRTVVVSIRVGLIRRQGSTATLRVNDAAGHLLGRSDDPASRELCVTVPLRAGRTLLTALPAFGSPLPSPGLRPTESDPFPAPSKDLGVTSIRVGGAPCPRNPHPQLR